MLPVPDGLFREFQLLQLPLGASCQICQSASSEPMANASRRPSSFTYTLKGGRIPSFVGLPRAFQLLQLPLVASCQMCQIALSAPVAKTSSRPSSFSTTIGLLSSIKPVGGWLKAYQLPQVPPGVVCQICQRSLEASTPRVQTKASRRPSSFFPTEGLALIVPGVPSEVQLLVAIALSFFKSG